MTQHISVAFFLFFFSFTDLGATYIYTLSLHDALPICGLCEELCPSVFEMKELAEVKPDADVDGNLEAVQRAVDECPVEVIDRKSTRLNSSHVKISYAVFCLKKKKHMQLRGIRVEIKKE